MGYRSKYRLTVRGAADEALDEIARVISEHDEMKHAFDEPTGSVWDHAGDVKWYGHEKDMAALSKQFPGIRFLLDVLGEDQIEPRTLSFYEGTEREPPLSRDELLRELSRSLRATHPERAEELIAALEKAMPITLAEFHAPARSSVVHQVYVSNDSHATAHVRISEDGTIAVTR